MQALAYCCGRKYTFNPRVLCCYGKRLCTISRDAKYFSYQNRYTFCRKCFNDIPADTVTLGDKQSQSGTSQIVKKDQFKEMKNDHLEPEPFVDCRDCGRKQHQICVLYFESIWPDGFVCDNCMKNKGAKRKENEFNAKRLPVTKLSIYIETRVNNFLKKKEAGAGEVHIRVLSSLDKMVEVKPGMRSRFVELNAALPYRAKALFAFEELDGVDVCFFGMHVQEYGSECANPNTRRVYIAHLDSVDLFQPSQYRTAVYHEILLGYLDYVKQLGYTMAHIWTCPPCDDGDDFIFNCHPIDQKMPKGKGLQEWFTRVLDKGMIERTIRDYKDIWEQAREDELTSAAEVPYFQGDFWPNVLEESIKDLNEEEEEKWKQAEVAEAAIFNSMNDEHDASGNDRKKAKTSSNEQQTGSDLSAKVFAAMEKHKEAFFVIRLYSAQSAASLAVPIQDLDPLITCDLMDGRDAFLTFARDKHLEFSSLRRAQFSTLCMLYELHNRQGQDKIVYKLGLDRDDGSVPSDLQQANSQAAREQSIQKCIESLVHACQCTDADCRWSSCLKMKRVVGHTKLCKRKVNGGCPICKQLIALCCSHAEHCQDAKCPVSFCRDIKIKLEQQRLQQRLQQAQLLRRRMAMASVWNTPSNLPASGSMSPSSVFASGSSMGLHQGIGLTPGTQTPPANVLPVVEQVQEEEAPLQQMTHGGGFGEVAPTGVQTQRMQHIGGLPNPQQQQQQQQNLPMSGPGTISNLLARNLSAANYIQILLGIALK